MMLHQLELDRTYLGRTGHYKWYFYTVRQIDLMRSCVLADRSSYETGEIERTAWYGASTVRAWNRNHTTIDGITVDAANYGGLLLDKRVAYRSHRSTVDDELDGGVVRMEE
jgi:hypothetical protein